jgi:hypothetical protein
VSYLDDIAATIRDHVAPGSYPEEGSDALFRLYAVLALAKGEAVTRGDVHDAWSAWMQERDPCHRSLKPFHELDAETQAADEEFVAAIRSAARDLASGGPSA